MKEWQRDVVSHICGKFLAYQQDLEAAFNAIDTDGNGQLSYHEFVTAIKGYDLGITEAQCYEFISSVDTDKNGLVDYSEFRTRFGHEFGLAEHSNWIKTTVNEVAKKIVTQHKTIKQSFLTFDSDGDHRISYKEFSHILKRDLNGDSFTAEQRRELFQYIDQNNSGAISYKEFKTAFSLGDTKDPSWENQIIQTVCDAIRKSKVQLKAVFREMDTDHSGNIDVQEFRAGLEAMNILLQCPMTDVQIAKLHKAVDKDGDGYINYDEFLKSFEIKLIL
jgi:Ca2+-binding EF-hand superfamily protein